jgi:hypothetical protein
VSWALKMTYVSVWCQMLTDGISIWFFTYKIHTEVWLHHEILRAWEPNLTWYLDVGFLGDDED